MYQNPNQIYRQPVIVNSSSQSNVWVTVFTILFLIIIVGGIAFGIYTGVNYVTKYLKSNTENKCDTTKFDLLQNGDCYQKCYENQKRCDNTSNCCFTEREDCINGKCHTKCQVSNGIQTIRCGETDICYDPVIEGCAIPNINGKPDPSKATKCAIAKLNKYGECCKPYEVVDINTGECKKCGTDNVQCEGECCLEGEDCSNGSCCAKTDILNSASNDKLQLCCKSPLEKCVVNGKNVCCGIGQKCINGQCVQPCGDSLTCDPVKEKCYQDLQRNYSCILKDLNQCGEWGSYVYDPPLYDRKINVNSPVDGFKVSYNTNDNSSDIYYNINSNLDSNIKLKQIDIKVNVPSKCNTDLYCQMKVSELGVTNTEFTPRIVPGSNTCTAKIDSYQVLSKDAPIKCPLVPDTNESCCRSLSDPTKYTGKICYGKCWRGQCVCRENTGDIINNSDGSYSISTYTDANKIIRKNCDIILTDNKCIYDTKQADAKVDFATGNCVSRATTCNNNGNISVRNNLFLNCICDVGFKGNYCDQAVAIDDLISGFDRTKYTYQVTRDDANNVLGATVAYSICILNGVADVSQWLGNDNIYYKEIKGSDVGISTPGVTLRCYSFGNVIKNYEIYGNGKAYSVQCNMNKGFLSYNETLGANWGTLSNYKLYKFEEGGLLSSYYEPAIFMHAIPTI